MDGCGGVCPVGSCWESRDFGGKGLAIKAQCMRVDCSDFEPMGSGEKIGSMKCVNSCHRVCHRVCWGIGMELSGLLTVVC